MPAERRPKDRNAEQFRPLTIETDVNLYAEGSALIKMGNTHVLCVASIQEDVPDWLKGKGQGWVTAEYSMLPRSTHTRSKRERTSVGGRTQEIQRLIGRALRAMVDMKILGERSITVDCDVLQADGGTRTASINGACVALSLAFKKLLKEGKLLKNPQVDTVSAISVGIKDGQVLCDLDYLEDSSCEVDMNFVVTGKGEFIEVQGTGEKKGFSKQDLDRMIATAEKACGKIKEAQLSLISK